MKNYLYLPLFFCFLFSFSDAFAYKVPKKAQKLLNSLPDKRLTLDLIMKKGFTSDAFKLIQSQGLQTEFFKYSNKIAFDTYLSGSLIKGNDQSAPTRPGAFYNHHFTRGVIKLNKAFSTGTQISLESNYQDTNSFSRFSNFGSDIKTKYKENKISLTINQSLVKNAFGSSSRNTIRSLKIQKNNVKNTLIINTEKWALSLIESFYTAWLLQSKVKVALANYKRQTRLFNITSIKYKRGTSEKSEVLQTKSLKQNSNQTLKATKQDLQTIWSNLIVSLNFPKKWKEINPLLVPLELDNPTSKAKKFCKKDLDLNLNTEFLSLKKKNTSNKLNLSVAKNQLLPDVYLAVTLTSNGVNPENISTAFKNSLKNENPGFFIQLGMSIPLGNYKEKAQLVQDTIKERSSYYQLASLKKELSTKWTNECKNLLRLKKKKIALKKIYYMQKQRASLEEKQFRIGRNSVFTTLQAGQDATLAEVFFKQSEIELRLSAWKILSLNGQLIKYITSIK